MVTEKGFDRGRGAEPRLARARARLTRDRASYLALLDGSPPEATRRTSSGGGWSALEILEHLARTEHGVGVVLRAAVSGQPLPERVGTQAPRRVKLPWRWRLVLLSRGIGRATSPRALTPQPGRSAPEVRAMADKARQDLVTLLAHPDAARLAQLRYPHPFLGDLDGIEWIEFLAAHEERHLSQARATLARLV